MKQDMECLQTNGSSRFASEDIQELGHEKQYLFNEQIEQVQQVRDKVDVGSTAADTLLLFEKACVPLQKGETLINLRQKYY